MDIESQRERRRLRSALDSMHHKWSMARTGLGAGIGLLALAEIYTEFPAAVRWAMVAAAVATFVLMALPFFRAPCPRCGDRYHGLGTLLAHSNRALPCRACGFDIDKHVSMY